MNTYFKSSKIFLYASVFSAAIVLPSLPFPFVIGKFIWFRVLIDLALISFLAGLLINQKQEAERYVENFKKVFYSPIGIAVSVFVLMFILAGIFSMNPSNSFWSDFERGEGGFQILHLYFFFLLLSTLFLEEKQWLKIFNYSIVAAVLVVLYGVFAGFLYFQNNFDFFGPIFGSGGRFWGAIGNSAYLATYLIFIIFCALYVFSAKYRHKILSVGGILIFVSIIIFLAAFLAAATRGAVLGLIAAVIAFLLYLIFTTKRFRKILVILIISLILIFSLGIKFKDSEMIKKLPFYRIFDISVVTQSFHDRTIVWKMAWDGFKERPLLGWGPENFPYVFVKHFNVANYNPLEKITEFSWFDKAHSIIFDYLAGTGILGLLSFIGIFIVYYWQFFKTRIKNQFQEVRPPEINRQLKSALLFALPVAYFVQGLVLFDVLTTYINLFLFFAFAYYFFNFRNANRVVDKKNNEIIRGNGLEFKIIGFLGIIIAIASIIYGSFLPYLKAKNYNDTMKKSYTIENFKIQFDKVYSIPSPIGNSELSRFLVNSAEGTVSERTYQSESITRELINYAESKIDYNDARFLIPMANIYNTMWNRYHKEDDYQKSNFYYLKSLEIGPKFPPALYGLISLYVSSGDMIGVENVGKNILQYWPQDKRVSDLLNEINKIHQIK